MKTLNIAEKIKKTTLISYKKNKTPYGITQTKEGITFVFYFPQAKTVQIAGDFNNWQPEKTYLMKTGNNGIWKTILSLPAGKYCYRLVVDGKWQQDPYNNATEPNPYGELNSVLQIV